MLSLPRNLVVMFIAIAIGFLITFFMTVINRKRDESKSFDDDIYPLQQRANVDKSSYGSMNKSAVEQVNVGPNPVTYCVIDGRMIDKDDPIPKTSLRTSLH